MSDISERYAQLGAAFADVVAKVPGDRWENQSPCEEWTARDVVRHVVDTQGYFLALVGRSLGEIPSVDDDPVAAWDAARAVVQADLDAPERAGAEFDGFFGRTRFDAAVDMFLNFDLVVHRWDLARATGGDELIVPDEIDLAWERVARFGDNVRRKDVCGEEVTPPEGADAQTRLLAKLGRQA
ncbi:TIGR03086 family protein [Spiractinospora alimapuensis]|uniref:TIGR03086 family metal-binding protein n=1 Tax=Spiractinospora alimapuensis TaxID=2820884 RepID=UPI001F24E65D|nr:TIGR03086 family metal-binding protein [Spiractinospora alimapuensis]QVQ50214.1 TIGR03086 family protein [Spiractinospora alimapuensis]